LCEDLALGWPYQGGKPSPLNHFFKVPCLDWLLSFYILR
jgi:hypothetical protein